MLLWTYNIYILAIIHNFADKWHILQAEQGQFSLDNLLWSSKYMLRLPIKCTLPKNGSNQTPFWQIIFNLGKDLMLRLSRAADNHNVRSRNHFFCILWNFVYFADQVTTMLPAATFGKCLYLRFPKLWPSRKNIYFKPRVHMTHCRNCSMS